MRNVPFPGGMPNSFATQGQLDSYGQTCRTTGAAGGGAIHNHVRREWMNGIGGQTVFNTLNVPNTPNPDCHPCAGCGWYDSAGVWSARSQHTGGAHVLMADGAVRFASDKASGRNCRTANRSLTRKRRIRCGASFACASGFSGEAFSCRSPNVAGRASGSTRLLTEHLCRCRGCSIECE